MGREKYEDHSPKFAFVPCAMIAAGPVGFGNRVGRRSPPYTLEA